MAVQKFLFIATKIWAQRDSLTQWGWKVFIILAFFWILITQKTHLNIQNPTVMKTYKGTKPVKNNLFYV